MNTICSPFRCPSRDDPYMSQLIPIPYPSDLEMPDNHKRFMFKMFSFVDDNGMEHINQQVMNSSIYENLPECHTFVLLC